MLEIYRGIGRIGAFASVAVLAEPILAENVFNWWGSKGSGDYGESSMYIWRTPGSTPPPMVSDTARFLMEYCAAPSTVTFSQTEAGGYLTFDKASSGKEWSNTITFSGAGSSRQFDCRAYEMLGGREVIFDGMEVFCSLMTGDRFYQNQNNRLHLLNCTTVDFSPGTSGRRYFFILGGETTVNIIDGSSLKTDYLYMPDANARLSMKIRNGGSFSAKQSNLVAGKVGDIRVVDGDVTVSSSTASSVVQFLPERTGSATFGGVLSVPSTIGSVRLGGSAKANGVTLSGPTVFYGRGNLQTTSFNTGKQPVSLDLSTLTLGAATLGDSTMTFLDDTSLWPTTANVSLGTSDNSASIVLRGKMNLCVNPKDDAATERTWTVASISDYTPDAALSFSGTGLGSVHSLKLGRKMPERFGGLSLGTNVKVSVSSAYPWYWSMRLHDLHLSAGSELSISHEGYDQLMATGAVTVDPTAKIKVRAYGTTPRPLLTALDEIPDGVVTASNLADGWVVGHNGGSYFYWKGEGQHNPGYTYFCSWKGAENANWNNSNNWYSGRVPDQSDTVYITGYRHLTMTNDVANLHVKNIYYWADWNVGPYVITGNPITIHSTDTGLSSSAGIYSTASYPEIFDCDINSDQSVLGVSAGFQANDYDASVLCFRKGVNVPNGTFAPCGDIVIDGTVTAKDLCFVSMTGKGNGEDMLASNNRTELAVRDGGKVIVTDQTTANAATGHFWIARGGLVSIAGDWICNTASNENLIAGSMTVSGKLGGDASQTYYGKGILSAAGTDGKDGATLRVGNGLTLVPTAATFGDMPIEVLWGGVTLAPTEDATMGQAITVSGLGSQLVAAGEKNLTLERAVEGADFDIVKRGVGTLTLAAENEVEKGRLILEGGTLAILADQRFDGLEAKPGTTLAYGEDATVFLGDSVDLTGVTIQPVAGVSPSAGYVEVLRVPCHCHIKGVQVAQTDKAKLRVVTNDDGSVSLEAKALSGLMLIFR